MSDQTRGPSRRALLGGAAAVAAAPIAAVPVAARAIVPPPVPGRSETVLTVNDHEYRVSMDTRTTLLDALREHIQARASERYGVLS